MKKEVIINIKKVNIICIILFFTSFALLAIFQISLHTEYYFKPSWIALVYIILVIPAHEGLHAIGFMLLSKAPKVNIKFGLHKKYFMPYCHCSNFENTKFGYISSMLLPNIILTIITIAIIFFTSNIYWSLVSSFVVSSGAGDYYMAYLVLKYPNTERFIDHPTEPGFYVIE
ncbi:DUF3267 domain-containing protein [Clostridium sp. Cult2]|uniref:DUF3267 domain-containing protein n=1 Tax=Clostridium sp. Cult2 TaxID=2079003 RepID=UPI001F32E57D|nr:DUF3267 domain-containing protein [Clostridium sp. Cult2]MCF6466328.1 hypothetical protein [Clostridium sp. Cult2]